MKKIIALLLALMLVLSLSATAFAAEATETISVNAADSLNRGQVAVMLYQANLLAKQSPGLSMYQ